MWMAQSHGLGADTNKRESDLSTGVFALLPGYAHSLATHRLLLLLLPTVKDQSTPLLPPVAFAR